jgi:hypothetical protein
MLLAKGARIMIYQKPMTLEDPEGQATIVKIKDRAAMGGDCTLALVHFDDDPPGEVWDRYIRNR